MPMGAKPKSPPPNRVVRTPAFKAPPGACDCHVHIIGPQTLYPLIPDAPAAFDDCTLADYRAVQRVLGLERAVVVMSVGHGYNYQHLLHLLCQSPDDLRGVAALAPDITDRELDILTSVGVVGARFLMNQLPEPELAGRVFERGWSAHFLVRDAAGLSPWADMIRTSNGRFVLEHTGLPDPEKGIGSGYFREILELLETGRLWIKLSPRFSKQTYPWSDTNPFMTALLEVGRERLLYGSDYPHPNLPGNHNEADFFDLMQVWVPGEADRHSILSDNPAELFGFPSTERV